MLFPLSKSCGISHLIVLQVRRLAMEVRQMGSARQITVLSGGGSVQNGIFRTDSALRYPIILLNHTSFLY